MSYNACYGKCSVAIKSVCPQASHKLRMEGGFFRTCFTTQKLGNRTGSLCVHTSFNVSSLAVLHVRVGGTFSLTLISGSSLKLTFNFHFLDFWPHGPPRAGITSQVHPSGCYGGGRGPRGDTPAAGSSPLWESSPLSEPSPSVGPPWAPASPQPLITPRHTVHLSSSWPERHLGAGRCLVHHQEVISGCTGDCWCPEQAEVFQVW